MTWLPISLKNAAKCDKWYQLQNHSITESLNAKGAWEKLFMSHPRACRILSVERTKKHNNTPRTVKKYVCVSVKIKESPSLLGEIHISLCVYDPRRRFENTHIHTHTYTQQCVRAFCVCVCETKTTQQKNTQRSFFGCGLSHIFSSSGKKCVSSFTDLSAAGLPAELKHITQRRKRKQP